MKLFRTVLILVLVLLTGLAYSQDHKVADSLTQSKDDNGMVNRHSVGSSLWVFYDKLTGNEAEFFELSYGYQFSDKDNLIVEGITWKYEEPMGSYGNSDELYPGSIRSYGVGLGYQRFLWKKSFTSFVATPFILQYYDSEGEKMHKGFQLYLQTIVGYRFEFFDKRWYVEPAWALKLWPINIDIPSAFDDIDEGTPDFIFEPSLNFGYKL